MEKHFELINSSKDASRTKAIEMYPSYAEKLSRKKDVNKSDAILIARFFTETGFKDDLNEAKIHFLRQIHDTI